MSKFLSGKYQLKSLHEEIDLFDRKLAHLLRYTEFSTDADRNAATRTLVTKRETLARAAREMASEGVEYSESDLPRSFRADPSLPPDAALTAPPAEAQAEIAPRKRRASPHPSPYAGTSMDFQKGLLEYKRKKKKA
jgi:hypothetical protein